MDKKDEYIYYKEWRSYLINVIHSNEIFTHAFFLIFLLVLYIIGIKDDLFSFALIIVICLFIIDGLGCARRASKALKKWDSEYKNNL